MSQRKLKRWRRFLRTIFGEVEDEYKVSIEDFSELESLNELEDYGLKEEDVELVLRLKEDKEKGDQKNAEG